MDPVASLMMGLDGVLAEGTLGALDVMAALRRYRGDKAAAGALHDVATALSDYQAQNARLMGSLQVISQALQRHLAEHRQS